MNNSHNRSNKWTNVKIIFFLHAICHKSDMFQSILIILRESLYINKVYITIDGLLNTLKFVHKNVCRYHKIISLAM